MSEKLLPEPSPLPVAANYESQSIVSKKPIRISRLTKAVTGQDSSQEVWAGIPTFDRGGSRDTDGQ